MSSGYRKVTYSVEEAAALLGVSKSKVYDSVRSGELRGVQLGRRVVIPFDVLEALLGVLPPPEDDGRDEPGRPVRVPAPSSPSVAELRGTEMNAVHLIGSVVRDPELRYSKKGMQVCLLQLAVPRRRRDGKDRGAVQVDVVTFGSLAEVTSGLGRGSHVAVSGHLGQREWTSSDGSLHSRYEIIAEDVECLSGSLEPNVAS
jgi:excisionase family DNA binding protein